MYYSNTTHDSWCTDCMDDEYRNEIEQCEMECSRDALMFLLNIQAPDPTANPVGPTTWPD
jgi:hypothetical protein